MNLVDLIKGQFSGDVVSRLAEPLGTNSDGTQSAISAAVPALLAGMTKLADSPEGSSRLASAVDNLDDKLVANPAAALSGGGNSSILERGSNILGSLFGPGISSGLGSALGRFTGLGGGAISSLLGFLTPMVLGMLKRQKQQLGLDAGGLSNLLAGQKQNILGAMPSGLSSVLGAIPGMNLGGAVERTGERVSQAYDSGRAAVDQGARYAAAGAGSAARWLLPVLGLVLLGGLIWWLASRGTERTQVASPTPQTVIPAKPADPEAAADAGLASANLPGAPSLSAAKDQVSGFFKSTTEAFSNITDASSAENALPQLRDLNTKLDGVSTAVNALPADAKTQVTAQFQSLLATLKPTIEKVMAIPGVSDKIKPVVDQMMGKFNAFAGH